MKEFNSFSVILYKSVVTLLGIMKEPFIFFFFHFKTTIEFSSWALKVMRAYTMHDMTRKECMLHIILEIKIHSDERN